MTVPLSRPLPPRRRIALVAATALVVAALATVPACARREGSAEFEKSPLASETSSEGAPGPGIAFARLTLDEALRRAGSEKKLVMVDLYADWCGWCKKLEKEVFADARVGAAAGRILAIRIDTDEESGGKIAERFGVQGLPTVLFLSPQGRVVKRIDGFVRVDAMLRILKSLPETA